MSERPDPPGLSIRFNLLGLRFDLSLTLTRTCLARVAGFWLRIRLPVEAEKADQAELGQAEGEGGAGPAPDKTGEWQRVEEKPGG